MTKADLGSIMHRCKVVYRDVGSVCSYKEGMEELSMNETSLKQMIFKIMRNVKRLK